MTAPTREEIQEIFYFKKMKIEEVTKILDSQ